MKDIEMTLIERMDVIKKAIAELKKVVKDMEDIDLPSIELFRSIDTAIEILDNTLELDELDLLEHKQGCENA